MSWPSSGITARSASATPARSLGSPVAYTTVMTTMDRLFKKGLLTRRQGRAARFVYRAAATREEIEGAVATELVQSLCSGDGSEPLPMLSSLVDAVSDRDRALLDDLERLIREKRRQVERREDAMIDFFAARRHARARLVLLVNWPQRRASRRGAGVDHQAMDGHRFAAVLVRRPRPAGRDRPGLRRCRLPAVVLAVRAARLRRRFRHHADGVWRLGAVALADRGHRPRRAARGRVPSGARASGCSRLVRSRSPARGIPVSRSTSTRR